MKYSTPPPNLRSLEQRIRNLEPHDTGTLRRQITMAMVVVGQMLPEGAVKGGTAMALRYGQADIHALALGGFTHPGQVIDQIAHQGVVLGEGDLAGDGQFQAFHDLVIMAVGGFLGAIDRRHLALQFVVAVIRG